MNLISLETLNLLLCAAKFPNESFRWKVLQVTADTRGRVVSRQGLILPQGVELGS